MELTFVHVVFNVVIAFYLFLVVFSIKLFGHVSTNIVVLNSLLMVDIN